MRLPMTPEEITPEWLNSALRSAGSDVTVKSVRLGTRIGGAASKIRLHLEYAGPVSLRTPPNTMVLKACMEEGRDLLMAAGFYHHEADFYRNVRDRYDVRAPRSYFAAGQRAPDQAVILLEDLGVSNVRFGLSLTPYAPEQVDSALEALAMVHGRSMTDDRLAELKLPVAMDDTRAIFDFIIQHAGQSFNTARGYSVPVALHDVGRLSAAMDTYRAFVQSTQSCLVHGDAHVGNSYIRPDGVAGWLDWQLAGLGHWIHDVAYFMGGALDVPARRCYEKELLAHYLEVARRTGADMPNFEEAWLAYRRALFYGFIVWLGTDATHQPETICTACLGRFGAAMIDHDVYGVLGV